MLCPKCGKEYEGTKCPNCDGLDIIVNQEDYLKRRREYEEKQAAQKSASSDEEKNLNEGLRPDELLDKIVKVGEQARKKIVDKKEEKEEEKKKKSKKARMIAIAAIGIFVAVLVICKIYQQTNQKNNTLYFVQDNTIYRISNTNTQQTYEYNEVIFESDKNRFHIQSFPQNIQDVTIKERMASENEKYYSASIYNDINYSILVWNDENYNILAENNKEKKLLYVDDAGYVLYQETEVINEEGSVGAVQLYISKIESDYNVTTTLLSEDVKNVYVYSDKKTVIFYDAQDTLYTYVYGKNPQKMLIAQEVTSVCGAVKDSLHLFSYKAPQVNTLKNCNGFIYSCNDSVYYFQLDFSDGAVYLGKNSDTNLTYIVDKEQVIAIQKNKLMCTNIVEKKVEKYTQLDVLGASNDVLYDSDSQTLLFINENHSLLCRQKGKMTTISDEVEDGTLNWIVNQKGAFTYVCNQIQVYCKNVKNAPVKLAEEGNTAQQSEIFYQKDKLYFINTQEKLYSCSTNGKNGTIIGDANRIIFGK